MAEEEQSTGMADTATTVATAVGELIRAAGDSKEAKQAGAEVGKVLVTVTKALNNVLLPLAALNNGFDRARAYFDKRFGEDIAEKTKQIPPESLIEPKLLIAGPVIQNLAFTLEDPPLKDMYLELLGKAMDERQQGKAHPAFVEIIRQITSEEAKELNSILRANQIAIANIREARRGGGSVYRYEHLLDWRDPDNMPALNPKLPMMIINWIRLGLIEVDYDRWLRDDHHYAWIEHRPEFRTINEGSPPKTISTQKGILSVTSFGKEFAESTGLRPSRYASVVEKK